MVNFFFVLLFAAVLHAASEQNIKSPTPTENNERSQTDSIKMTENIVEAAGKHVPVAADRQCCGCGDCPGACSSLTIYTDGYAKSGEPAKHVPVAMTRECCGCDNTASPSGDCSVSSIYTDGQPPRRVPRVTGKVGCETVTGDPRVTFVTVGTTTIYTTRVSTLRRILRTTSFSTTTVTSTVRLTKTDLSISARTVTTNLFFTQPTFVLITRYFYVDSTSITTTSAPTFVQTYTEIDTIVLNSIVRTTTFTTTTESTFSTLNTFSVTDMATFSFTFTDPTNFVITEGPSTNFFTIALPITYTTYLFPTILTYIDATTTVVRVRSQVSTSSVVSILYVNPTTVFYSETIPRLSIVPTAAVTLLIE